MAPNQLIKNREENKWTIINTSNPQLRKQHSKNSESGQLQTPKQSQFCSNYSETQSALTQTTISTEKTTVPSESSIHLVNHTNKTQKMSGR